MAAALNVFWLYATPTSSSRLARLERALALPWEPTSRSSIRTLAEALEQAAQLQFWSRNRTERARDLFDEAGHWFAAIGDQARTAGCVRDHGSMLMVLGDLGGSRRELRESLTLGQACGDEQGEAWCLLNLGQTELVSGDPVSARTYAGQALERFERLGSAWAVLKCRVDLVEACRQARDWPAAVEHGRRALEVWRTHAFVSAVTDLLDGLAMLAADLRRFEDAAELFGAAEHWRQAHQEPTDFCHRRTFARGAAAVQGQLDDQAWVAARNRGAGWSFDQAARRVEEVLEHLTTILRTGSAGLTPREVEVLGLVARGLSNADIAGHLVVSRRTVHAHLRSIFDKLGVSTRTAAAHKGVDLLLPQQRLPRGPGVGRLCLDYEGKSPHEPRQAYS